MKKLDDETLMAFVDAELSEEERKEVEQALVDDPQARSKVEEFRKTRMAIDQFADILDDPVPDHLIETIRQHEQQSQVIQFPERPRPNNWFLLAASLIMGISLGAIATDYFLSQSYEKKIAIVASKNTGLSASIEAAKTERDTAREKTAMTESDIAGVTEELENALAEKQAAERKAATAAAKIADISKELKVVLAEKNLAQKKAASAESRLVDVARELEVAVAEKSSIQEKAAIIRTRISKALQVAIAEKEEAQEKATTAIASEKFIDLFFPIQLVEKAIDNGSKIPTGMQKLIAAELNAEASSISTASSFSRLSPKPTGSVTAAGAAQLERLEDLQPDNKEGLKTTENMVSMRAGAAKAMGPWGQSRKIRNILGEFSFDNKTCRLFEHVLQNTSEAAVIIACKKAAGNWEIVQRENLTSK
jgi:hypothetical protein